MELLIVYSKSELRLKKQLLTLKISIFSRFLITLDPLMKEGASFNETFKFYNFGRNLSSFKYDKLSFEKAFLKSYFSHAAV